MSSFGVEAGSAIITAKHKLKPTAIVRYYVLDQRDEDIHRTFRMTYAVCNLARTLVARQQMIAHVIIIRQYTALNI